MKLHIEEKIDLSHLGINDGGKVDLWLQKRDGMMHIVDYKSGRAAVKAENNLQLAGYASGVSKLAEYPITGYTLWIMQPGVHLDYWVITPDELSEWEQRIVAIVDAAKADDAPLISGSHCHFCRARSHCPAVKGEVKAIAAQKIETLAQTLAAMTPAAVNEWAQKLEIVTEWCETARDILNSHILAGNTVDGYKIVNGKRDKIWRDGAEAALRGEPKAWRLQTVAAAEKAGVKCDGYYEVKVGQPYVKKV